MADPVIHPSAIVHPKAILGENVTVGPFAMIEEGVQVGTHSQIHNHAVLKSGTQLGEWVSVYPFAVIGGEPQHLGYKGEPTRVRVGNKVTLRESVTIHGGTPFGHSETVIGDGSYLMAYTHVGHDCIVGRNVIMANLVQLAGHVEVEDYATVGGMSAVVQHCRVGRYAYIGGGSLVRKDLAPFLAGKGNDFEVQGINVVGLTRNGFKSEAISRLKMLYRIFFLQNLTVVQALDKVGVELGDADEVKVFRDFLQKSKVGLHR